MKHKLQRYEEHLHDNGAVDRIFVSVAVTDDAGDFIVKEAWLTPDEVGAVKADRAALEPIAHRLAALGELELERIAANRKPPPIVIVDRGLEELPVTFEDHKIGAHKAEIIADIKHKEAEEAARVKAAHEQRLKELVEEKARIEKELSDKKNTIEAQQDALTKEDK